MNQFSKTATLLVLWSLWACTDNKLLCRDDAECPYGSFCFKADSEGLCTWGELAPDGDGIWAVLPKMEVSSNFPIETNSSNSKLKKITTYLEPDSSSTPTSYSGKIQLHIRAYGATSILAPSGSNGMTADCYTQAQEKVYIERMCILVAHVEGKYSIHTNAANDNGTNTLALSWDLLPHRGSELSDDK